MDRKKFMALCAKVADLVTSKSRDYQRGPVKFEEYFKFGHTSFVQMERTKVLRLTSLVSSAKPANFEGIKDTVYDLIAYAVFHLGFIESAQGKIMGADNLRSVSARFHAAKNRCTNPRNAMYKWYGKRGIKFQFKSIEQMLQELGPCPDGHVLDRINNDGHYAPGNVRWATVAQSNHNRGMRVPGTSGVTGVSKTVYRWVAYTTGGKIADRKMLYQGQSREKAIQARKQWEAKRK